jgi:5-(carboxyamino)imidazole ribonucleotide synthase
MNRRHVLAPGSTIGILGGGQLGRMLALAAARLGFKCHIFAPEIDSPAFDVGAEKTLADYRDELALAQFAQSVHAATYEFENVPVETVQFLDDLVPVRPGALALSTAQDRLREKTLARKLGALTANFAGVSNLGELQVALQLIGMPAVLKTTRFGYDGKGQVKITAPGEAVSAWEQIGRKPAILERFVDFDQELSVVCARSLTGEFVAYDVVENVHLNHILHTSTVPAHVHFELAQEAIYVSRRVADALDYVGVLAVEFFAAGDVLTVNEIAPRVHNSGHWTMDACSVSQFEQHIRAVAGWPLGSAERHSDAVMTNLIGDEVNSWLTLAGQADVSVHLYGKTDTRPGRKMGHFNRLTGRAQM